MNNVHKNLYFFCFIFFSSLSEKFDSTFTGMLALSAKNATGLPSLVTFFIYHPFKKPLRHLLSQRHNLNLSKYCRRSFSSPQDPIDLDPARGIEHRARQRKPSAGLSPRPLMLTLVCRWIYSQQCQSRL